MGIFKPVKWLYRWLEKKIRREFEWDEGNRSKIARKHGVSRTEIEEVFNLGFAAAVGEQILPHADEGRYAIVGPTRAGRLIFVIFTLRDDRIRPISARDATNWERDRYAEG
jgi:hypothetical protein